jgi:Tol biopolymer transport system component
LFSTSISGDGSRIAYTSGAVLAAYIFPIPMTTGSAIHSFDAGTGEVTPVTYAPVLGPIESGNVTVNGDGSKVVFDSTGNLTGENADRSREVFLYDAQTGGLTQLTDTEGRFSLTAAISGDGTKVAFRSNANWTGDNADLGWEIFLLDVAAGTFTQVTDTTDPTLYGTPSVDDDGSRIAFHSRANLTGANGDGNYEIFLYDAASDSLLEVTDTSGGFNVRNQSPSLDGDGTRIAFNSTANLTGQNADGNDEVFLYDVLAGTFTQLTKTTEGRNVSPSLDGNATRIAFQSTANLTGDNADANMEVFVYDFATNAFFQISDGGGEQPSISDDGTRISFRSSADLTDQNPDGNAEIFLATVQTVAMVDVHLFYNNSAHDGNGPAVTAADFNAIARDKTPLLFGETASFASISGYSRGINGMFIDVPDLPADGAGMDAGDLQFTVGADNYPDTWAAAPAPTSVGVFPNAGGGGADRIYVTFADRAIVDKWLGITILATADTGLASAATFFYGSVPGETGAAFVGQGQFFGRDAADQQTIAIDLFHTADVENPNDLNHDGRVDAFDLQVIPVAGGGRIQPNVLSAITPQSGAPAAAAVDEFLAADGAAASETDEIPFRPAHNGLGSFDGPADERVGGKEATDHDLVFATFAGSGVQLAPGELRMTLVANELVM